MKQQVMSILTRTPMHVGAGASVGIVDLPIIRERHTGFPIIPGSSLKGALAALWSEDLEQTPKSGWVRKEGSNAEKLFGKDRDNDNAHSGALLIGEAKILAFPVRSAKNAFAWCTCPLIIRRYFRDFGVVNAEIEQVISELPALGIDHCLAAENLIFAEDETSQVVLEEYCLQAESGHAVLAKLVNYLRPLSSDFIWRDELAQRLVLLSDDMFTYFVQNACEVSDHVKIDPGTRAAQGEALFNQENIPSETMFYSVLAENMGLPPEARSETQQETKKLDCFAVLSAKLQATEPMQIGANATTGQGWCSVELIANA